MNPKQESAIKKFDAFVKHITYCDSCLTYHIGEYRDLCSTGKRLSTIVDKVEKELTAAELNEIAISFKDSKTEKLRHGNKDNSS